ncbi:hypothetical protein UFOVP142_60 [uncultured Caudovirales phage]|uniref:Uncharacterized protein n=1 Tax=uncultured Caudovirales phage TaxID=2100421 RepID=A0A6J7XNC2_9CAUD|nr:hypothetical protein UFOVP142_60 [uncultured Caudovirales phage]
MDNDPERKIRKYKDNGIFSIKAKDEWRHWIKIHASALGYKSTAEFITEAVREFAQTHKLNPPPERWK